MAVPSDFALTITIDSVDVTTYVQFDTIDFADYVLDTSIWRMIVDNPSGVTPAVNSSVLVIAKTLSGTPVIFNGIITECNERKRSNGIAKEYEIEAADLKIYLQKSLVEFNSFTGTDAEIIQDLIDNTYPDLSSLFDFSSQVDSFASGLTFDVNDDSLLDALKRLKDKTGANMRFDRSLGETINLSFGASDIVDEDPTQTTVPSWYTGSVGVTTDTIEIVSTGGNPTECLSFQGSSGFTSAGGIYVQLGIKIETSPATKSVTNVKFDIWFDFSENVSVTIFQLGQIENISGDSEWHSVDWDLDTSASLPQPEHTIQILIVPQATVSGSWEIRLDNVVITTEGDIPLDMLDWSLDAPSTDFNLDIQSSSEYGFNYNLYQGDIGDYNSVTVVGGKQNVSFDWTYHADGYQDHFDLELPIKGIAVYKNTNTDASPTWTAQTVGTLGIDTLASKDVLYDVENHWLLFASAPSELGKAIRVTGTYQKPIRTRVEDVPSGSPTFATIIYDDSITTEADAVAAGQAALNKRNAVKRLEFTTYTPYLKCGQAITVTDSARGLNETLVIYQVNMKWLGASGHAQFDIKAGDEDETSLDKMISTIDKNAQKKGEGAALPTTTTLPLYDTDGSTLLDTDGGLLYEVS